MIIAYIITGKSKLNILQKFISAFFTTILFVVSFLLITDQVIAANYYVDNLYGNDITNDGTQINPWASIRKSMYEVTAGDTVHIINNGPDNPYREEAPISPINDGSEYDKIIIQGPGKSQYAYISMSSNYTNGSPSREGLLLNKDMEYWNDANSPANWNISGSDYTVSREISEVYSGGYSLMAVRGSTSGNECNIQQTLTLRGTSNVTFTFHYKATENFSFLIKDLYTEKYWNADTSQWAGGYKNTVPSSLNWTQYSITFALNGNSRYVLWIQMTSDNSTTLLDQIRLTEQTNSWEIHTNGNQDTYKIYVSEPFTIFGALSSEWDSYGVNAVTKRNSNEGKYNDLNKGEWDWADNYLYYRLNDNETIETLHLEGNQSSDKVVNNNRSHILYRYLDASLGYQGFTDNYSTSSRYEYCRAHHVGKIGFSAMYNSSPVYEHCEASYAATEDGFHVALGAHVTCNYCKSHHNWDDGFQVADGAITANYSISYENGLEKLNGDGFSLHSGYSNTGTFHNCISYKNDGHGFDMRGTIGSVATVINSIAYENNGAQFTTDGILALTADFNNATNFSDPNWTVQPHDIIASPLFVDPANYSFSLQFTSPLIDAGIDVNQSNDFAGNQIYDHPDIKNKGSAGNYSKTYVDIGSYEYISPPDLIPQIAINPKNIDFRCQEIYPTAPKEKNLTIENIGNANVVIQSLSIDPPDNIFYVDNDNCTGITLEPHSTCDIKVIFNPISGEEGDITAELTFSFMDLSMSSRVLLLKGKATSTYIDADLDCVSDNEDDFPYNAQIATPETTTGTGKVTIDASLDSKILSLKDVQCISDTDPFVIQTGKPSYYQFKDGLVSYVVEVVSPGDAVDVDITFPSLNSSDNNKYYKVDENGFSEYVYAHFNGEHITFSLTDGGNGDEDGIANGEIVVQGGIGSQRVSLSDPPPSDNASGGRGKCFIATAAYGSYMSDDVMLLRKFRDEYLLSNSMGRIFVEQIYYKLSPPIADQIAKHESLKTATRIALMSLIYSIKHPYILVFVLVISGFLLMRSKRR